MHTSSLTMLQKYCPDLKITDNGSIGSPPSPDLPNAASTFLFGFLRPSEIGSFINFDSSTKVYNIEQKDWRTSISRQLTTAVRLASSRHREDEDREANALPSERGKNNWHYIPKLLLAGAVSTIISRTFVAPLERIKLECIIQGSGCSWTDAVRWVWTCEGPKGFWRGNMLNLFRLVPFKSINFICYDMYCNHVAQAHGGALEIRTRLVAPGGAALGGVSGCFSHMVRTEGFSSLYKGLTPALLSMGPSSAVFYGVYDMLKSSHTTSRRTNKGGGGDQGELSPLRTLIYGAIAGACAETVTYPLEVVRRQLQLQRAAKLGLGSTCMRLMKKDGVASLFVGLLPSTLQDICGTPRKDQAGMHHPRIGMHLDRRGPVGVDKRGSKGILEGQRVEPLPAGAVQVDQFHMLRHVLQPRRSCPRRSARGDQP
ncbi:hypothetical protein QJS04_geneDACA017890 [Acorus gramineus]|uniref:Mitochondrial carrier protein n=1 Tax=Acorus gramineus TaxID=55184 RepID=A0AAV9ALY2_ACOGR|nr:hypothetical protein QJS04_geneDACA017890 [Acorus gramineus]